MRTVTSGYIAQLSRLELIIALSIWRPRMDGHRFGYKIPPSYLICHQVLGSFRE